MLINSDIVCTDPRSVPVRGSHEHRSFEHSLVKGNNLTKPDPLTKRCFFAQKIITQKQVRNTKDKQ